MLWVSLGSAGSGLALVGLLAPVGLVPCTAVLAIRSACSTGAMAWLTRRDLPGMVRAYGQEVGLPFGLMLAGAWQGTALADRMLAGAGPSLPEVGLLTGDLLALAAAGVAAAGLMLLYFGLCLLLRRGLVVGCGTVR